MLVIYFLSASLLPTWHIEQVVLAGLVCVLIASKKTGWAFRQGQVD